MTLRIYSLLLLAFMLVACDKAPDKTEPASEPAKAGGGADVSLLPGALDKGVAWLRGQAVDGKWMVGPEGKKQPSAAHTALALVPVALSLPKDKRASDPLVKQASAFILSALSDDGAIRQGPASKYDNYFTATALMALTVVDESSTVKARQSMRDFLLTLQREEKGRIEGGFGYNTAGNADLSNSQFAIEALRAAGIPEEHPKMQQALRYLERVQNRSENSEHAGKVYEVKDEKLGTVKVVAGNDGSAPYEPGVSKAGLRKLPDGTYVARGYGSMTFALLKCYILVGLDRDDERVTAAVSWLAEHYTWDQNPGFDETAKTRPEAPYWGLFYYYMTAAKALRVAGIDTLDSPGGKRDWRKDLTAALLKRQRADGSWINTKAERWDEGDPLLATAYAAITLHEIQGSE